ncbi:glutamate receptor 1-like [Penaeus indicus]|uniref:glutamate receptor 1-like n=1 Tax=Penaeus indicus TaxID=29960 RepID=UPI00300C040D
MLREVKDRRVDVAVGPLGITLKRTAIVDFLIGVFESHIQFDFSFRIALRRPSNEDYMWTVYTKQFELGVWLILIFLTVGLVLCLYFVSHGFSRRATISFSDCAFTIFGFLCGQGSTLAFSSTAVRTAVITSLLLQVVTLSYYTSNLVSALTVGPPLPPFSDLGDIHAQSSITFGIVKGSRNTDDFTDSKNPLHQSVWRRMEEEDLALTAQDGMNRVYSENYALMLWGIYFKVNYAQDCRVFTLPTGYFPTYTSFALTKGSPLVPVFNKLVLDIISSGLLKKWWQELSLTSTDCSALETQPIELKTVLTPFLLLSGSILVSLGVLLVERYIANVFFRKSGLRK